MTVSELAERLIDEHMADSVLVIMTRSSRKTGLTEKWVSCVGNTYACTASADEWLEETRAVAGSNAIDRSIPGDDDEDQTQRPK